VENQVETAQDRQGRDHKSPLTPSNHGRWSQGITIPLTHCGRVGQSTFVDTTKEHQKKCLSFSLALRSRWPCGGAFRTPRRGRDALGTAGKMPALHDSMPRVKMPTLVDNTSQVLLFLVHRATLQTPE